MNASRNGLKEDEIRKLVSGMENAEEVIRITLDAMRDVRGYLAFNDAITLGLSVGLNDIPFDRAMVYGWIKELINGRKN